MAFHILHKQNATKKMTIFFSSFESNIIFSGKQTNHVHYLNVAEVYWANLKSTVKTFVPTFRPLK